MDDDEPEPEPDSESRAEIDVYVTVYRQVVRDLARAGYDVAELEARSYHDLAACVRYELYERTSPPPDKYAAVPTRLDIFAKPLHRVVAHSSSSSSSSSPTAATDEAWSELHTSANDPPSSLEWKRDWRRYVQLDVDHVSEIPDRIYVHFACFPKHTFKVSQFAAAINNICGQRGATTRDTFVFISHNAENPKMAVRKFELATSNHATKRKQGYYVIQFTVDELRVDVQAHDLVPPARVLHCRRVARERLARVAHVDSPEDELPVMNVSDAQARRLFVRPRQILECLVTSEVEVDSWTYFVTNFSENVNL